MSDNNARAVAGASTENATDAADTPEVAELEADIARTREELAQTVDQLAAKLDVKTRIRNRASETKDRGDGPGADRCATTSSASTGSPGRSPSTAGGGVVAAIATVVLVRWWMRPSRRRTRWRRR